MMQQTLGVILDGFFTISVRFQLPVTAQMQGPVTPDPNVCWRNLMDPFIDRMWAWNVLKCEIIGERFQVDGPLEARNCEQTFEFTAEIQGILLLHIVTGFDSEPISPE